MQQNINELKQNVEKAEFHGSYKFDKNGSNRACVVQDQGEKLDA